MRQVSFAVMVWIGVLMAGTAVMMGSDTGTTATARQTAVATSAALPRRIAVIHPPGRRYGWGGEDSLATSLSTFLRIEKTWKIPVDYLTPDQLDDNALVDAAGQPRHCLIAILLNPHTLKKLNETDKGMPEAKWKLLEKVNGKTCLWLETSGANITNSYIQQFWGVKGVEDVTTSFPEEKPAPVKIDITTFATRNFKTDEVFYPRKRRGNGTLIDDEFIGKAAVTDAKPVVWIGEGIPVVTLKGSNIYYGLYNDTFFCRFVPHMKILANIIMKITGKPIMTMGPYANLLIADQPTCGEYYARQGNSQANTMEKLKELDNAIAAGLKPTVYMDTHVIERDGSEKRIADLFPEAVAKFRTLAETGRADLEFEGCFHLDIDAYRKNPDKVMTNVSMFAHEFDLLDEAEQEKRIRKGREEFERVYGFAPKGWNSPQCRYNKFSAPLWVKIAGKGGWIGTDYKEMMRGEYLAQRFPEGYMRAMMTVRGGFIPPTHWRALLDVGFPIVFYSGIGGSLKLVQAWKENGAMFAFERDIVKFADEFNQMEVKAMETTPTGWKIALSCPAGLSQSSMILLRSPVSGCRVDGKACTAPEGHRIFLPPLGKGEHEVVLVKR